jgi:altronate dehydratase large subunit
MTTFGGYHRPDGRVGIRDHLLVLPLLASLAPVARAVAAELSGPAVYVEHEFEFATTVEENARVTRTFTGIAHHPNVNACVAIGDSNSGRDMFDALAELESVAVVDIAVAPSRRRIVEEACALARDLYRPAPREQADLSALIVATECGGSDAWSGVTCNPALGMAADLLTAGGATVVLGETTELIGAEHLLAQRAEADVAADLLRIVARYEQRLQQIGADIRGAQPTVGNIVGGLTTIEEKALGAAKKAGSGPVGRVIEYAEPIPTGLGGIVVMDTPGQDIEQMTGMVAGGSQIVVFTTGRGTPTGFATAPVIKVASNSRLFDRMRDDLDLNAGEIIEGMTIADVGRQIFDTIMATAEGSLTSAERRGANDFALSRFVSVPLAADRARD